MEQAKIEATLEDSKSLSLRATKLVNSTLFQRLVISAIIVSAVLIGLETSPEIMEKWGTSLKVIDRFLVLLFALEIGLRLASHGRAFWRFFSEPWNVFDFVVVAACLLPASHQYIVVLRLFRVLRVLRLVTTVPKLQLLVGALFKSIPSMGYIIVLLSVHFYIYAVLGTFLFGANDPWHFGSLGKSALTLFQVVTLEGWVEIMVTQIKGCSSAAAGLASTLCDGSEAFPRIAPLYFVSFIVLGTMIILNLFIGVVVNSMNEMQEELAGEDSSRSPEKIRKELALVKASLERLDTYLNKLERDRNTVSFLKEDVWNLDW